MHLYFDYLVETLRNVIINLTSEYKIFVVFLRKAETLIRDLKTFS